MSFRIQLPAGFSWWRVVGVLVGLSIPLLGLGLMSGSMGEGPGAVYGIVLIAVAGFIASAILLVTNTSGIWSRPFGRLFGNLFYPVETITQPPDDLLRALRQRLRDRYWNSATQQLDALTRAYGPSPELFHLRAHLVAGQTGDYRTVNAAAVNALPARGFDRYTALLRRDPPPRAPETGIDA
ncbi:MAG: hypothetical protein H7067_18785 [Burkholderiales bacterium]|nr:hypothetical protein [Opitutaceae bacterium]